MLRRTPCSRIANFNFGQAPLSREWLGGATKCAASAPLPAAQAPKITTSSNGARIVTYNSGSLPANCSVGAYVEAGAKFDPVAAPGLSYVFRTALTLSNMDNALFQIDRTLRSAGMSMEHLEVNKKFVGVRLDGRVDQWEAPLQNLLTTISAPRFNEADIERFRDTMDNQLEEQRWLNPREYTTDMVETLAFYKENLGSPRHVPAKANDYSSVARVLEFWAKHCTPNRVVISGVNIEHQALVAAYENNAFPHSSAAPHHARSSKDFQDEKAETSMFTGGNEFHEQEARAKEMGTRPMMEAETIGALAFQTFGNEGSIKEYASSLVAQQLANSIIGDGIRYERENTHIGVRSFYRPFAYTGIIGLTTRSAPGDFNKLLIDSGKVLKNIHSGNLAVAKTCAAVSFATQSIDSVRGVCDLLGTTVAKDGDRLRYSQEELLDAIKNVTEADIKKVQDLAQSSRPSLFVTGDTYSVPSLRQMGF